MSNQSKIRYHVVITKAYVEDTGFITSYGICCEEVPEPEKSEESKYQVIPDISTRQSLVEELIDKLTLYDADPVHFRDLIEDFIG